mmetsp:Transcript_20013/g.51159  ORF Transcript_20013/g.51159 Transcript_20013/m.51159 type:complete len:513 (+) Transcript_20013:90-1628(+)
MPPIVKAKAGAPTAKAPAKRKAHAEGQGHAPRPKAKAKAKAKPEDSDSDSDNAPAPKAKAKAKAKPADSDDTSNGSSDDSSDERAPKAKAKAKPADFMAAGASKKQRTAASSSLPPLEDEEGQSEIDARQTAAAAAAGPAFRTSLGAPSWRHAKCAVCKMKIGAKAVCFEFEDTAGLRAAQEDRRNKSEQDFEERRAELKRKRELKARSPQEYERQYPRRHRRGCACCEALGLDFYEPSDGEGSGGAEPEDSLDEEERQLEWMRGDCYSPFDDEDQGHLLGRFTWALHPTERCLGAWRKPNWWEKYRTWLPKAKVVAQSGQKKTKLSSAAKAEFKRVWVAIRKGKDSTNSSSAVAASSSSTSASSRGVLSAAQFATFQQKLIALKAVTKPELVRMLKHNDIQGVSSIPKARLADLVAIHQTLGVPAACPACRKGQVDFDWKTGEVTCRGHKVGMRGWRQCEGPTKAGKSWSQLERAAWREGLAPPPGPRAKARPFRPWYHEYSDMYDDYGMF